MKRFASIVLAVVVLSACSAISPKLGLTQAEDEAGYTATALGVDHTIKDGQVTNQYAVAAICAFDKANYTSIKNGRNSADGVSSYQPADAAHAAIQKDGSTYAPDFCVPVVSTPAAPSS